MRKSRLLGVSVFLVSVPLAAQNDIPVADPTLLTEIRQIKVIDNHAHPPALVNPGQKDDDFDALPCDPLDPTVPPWVAATEISAGRLFRCVCRAGKHWGSGVTERLVWQCCETVW